jgi:hypothetical protein
MVSTKEALRKEWDSIYSKEKEIAAVLNTLILKKLSSSAASKTTLPFSTQQRELERVLKLLETRRRNGRKEHSPQRKATPPASPSPQSLPLQQSPQQIELEHSRERKIEEVRDLAHSLLMTVTVSLYWMNLQVFTIFI